MIRWAALMLLGAVVGCSAPAAEVEQSDCERQVENAAVIDSTMDAVTDLDPAIETCANLAELEAASDVHPDAFDGASVRDFVTNRCLSEEALATTAICREVGD
jgi:hypothetical protein